MFYNLTLKVYWFIEYLDWRRRREFILYLSYKNGLKDYSMSLKESQSYKCYHKKAKLKKTQSLNYICEDINIIDFFI